MTHTAIELEKCAICGELTADEEYFIGHVYKDDCCLDHAAIIAMVCDKCGKKINGIE